MSTRVRRTTVRKRKPPIRRHEDAFHNVVDETMDLPGLDFFVGRQRGMKEAADHLRPKVKEALDKEREKLRTAVTCMIGTANKKLDEATEAHKNQLSELKQKSRINAIDSFLNATAYDST